MPWAWLLTCSIQLLKKFWVSLRLRSWSETVLSAKVRTTCWVESVHCSAAWLTFCFCCSSIISKFLPCFRSDSRTMCLLHILTHTLHSETSNVACSGSDQSEVLAVNQT